MPQSRRRMLVMLAGAELEGVQRRLLELRRQQERQARFSSEPVSERAARAEAERATRLKDEFVATLSHSCARLSMPSSAGPASCAVIASLAGRAGLLNA